MTLFRDSPQVLRPSGHEHVFELAPIPLYYRLFDEPGLNENLLRLAKSCLTDRDRQMGEELPELIDAHRESKMRSYAPEYLVGTTDAWIEQRENLPIGSHYWYPPNNFLAHHDPDVDKIRATILAAFSSTLRAIGYKDFSPPKISESWIQFYNPKSGHGHRLHSHTRYRKEEETYIMWSGGYYLDDGQPLADHIYSGKFVFNVRGYSYVIKPRPGLLMMWPNDILHEALPFYGHRDRVVLNFNLFAEFSGDRYLDRHHFAGPTK